MVAELVRVRLDEAPRTLTSSATRQEADQGDRDMKRTDDSGELSLRYPVHVVLSGGPDDEDGLVVVEVDGNDCLLLFRSRELAELYLEQAQAAGSEPPLTLRACHGDAELEHLLAQLPASVSHVVWDATREARVLKVTAVSDLLAVLREDAGEGGEG
jgi:hypothetical protein